MKLTIDERIALIKEVGEEIIEIGDLREMIKWKLDHNKNIYAYDGFEPSGNIHIAQGLLRAVNVNKLTKAGVNFKFLVADWHAAANQKFGGNLEIIKKVGDFFIEVWKVCGMNLNMVEFVYASEIVKDSKYWELVLNIAINSTLNRVIRCTQIMGRSENDTLSASQILYPLMQAADIFYLPADICQLGLDQRKVNMLAREVANKLGRPKPVAVHHHMLMGLTAPPDSDLEGVERTIALKMSKSNPDSAIFMLDGPKDVIRKINKAFCPPEQVEDNPILEYCKYIIFELTDEFSIERPKKYGGNVSYTDYKSMQKDYSIGNLNPPDLKPAVAKRINELLEPIRKHFEKNEKAKKLYQFVQKEYAKYTKSD
ncbi:MAG: tyrosine--tRNA ligase [Candidatus Lokiarchaeota archaeon]|nr:tyrosine--tRNA ligase [Candidatus Lokiarchaeota archaeon]MBD3341532.1 tyrosine--tRNA ligase [Candidatus Lokiarchaeota archaeon]